MPKSTLLGQPVVVHYTLLAGRACSFGGEAVSESERAFVVRDEWGREIEVYSTLVIAPDGATAFFDGMEFRAGEPPEVCEGRAELVADGGGLSE